MNWLGEIIQKHVTENDTVLDLGCGIMNTIDGIDAKSVLGCDIWEKYLDKIKDRYPTIRIDCVETDRFPDSSYDVVLCLDVIEHLDYEIAVNLLEECKRICRKKAVIFTPIRFAKNPQTDEGAWSLGENPYQEHKCVIKPRHLTASGYSVKEYAESALGVYDKWE